MTRIRPRRPARSFDLHHHLTTLFVCAVATVVLTRGFLAATGYPQVGGSKLHIAHVLWGGLLLLTALIATLAFLNPATKPLAAILGGVGFGLFIDEVGKFVTKDVDYFYRPAIAIIYVSFVVLWLVIRSLSGRGFRPVEATLIGLESLQRAAVGTLTDERRAQVLLVLRTAEPADALSDSVRSLLEQTAAVEVDDPPLTHRVSNTLAAVWDRMTRHRLFRGGVLAVILVGAFVSVVEIAWLLRNGTGGLTFSEKGFVVTTVAANVLLVIGLVRLSDSTLDALHWYDRAVLLEITVSQVFLYGSEQLAATLNLVVLLVLWALIRWAIHFESGRTAASLA